MLERDVAAAKILAEEAIWYTFEGLSTVSTISIGTPSLLTILVLKFKIVHSITCICV